MAEQKHKQEHKPDDKDTGTTGTHQFGVSGYLKPKQKTTKALDEAFDYQQPKKKKK